MAKKKKVSKKAPARHTHAGPKPTGGQLPEGFRSVVSVQSDAYFAIDEGAEIRGILLGRHARKDKPNQFYLQVRLTATCFSVQKKDDDGGYYNTQANPGEIVSIDEKAAMSGLREAFDSPGEQYECFVRFIERVPISGGQSYWRADCGLRGPLPQEDLPF